MSKCPKCIKALKTYNTEVKKEMTFNFTATQVMGTVEDPREDLVKKAVTCTIPSIDFKTADFAGGTGVYTKLSDKITFDAFTEAGKYEYTVKESASDPVINAESKYEKLIMSKAEYTMDVYVVEDRLGAFNIEKIIVNKTKDDEGHTATGKWILVIIQIVMVLTLPIHMSRKQIQEHQILQDQIRLILEQVQMTTIQNMVH